MSLLSGMSVDKDIKEEKDSVGGGSFNWDSAIYDTEIKMAYLKVADSGAIGAVITLADSDDRRHTETLWIQSGKAKGGNTYYVNKKGEKHSLPGFTMFRNICLLTLGKEPSALDTENKQIKLWSYDASAEIPQEVPVITELLNQKIAAGILKSTVDKTAKGDDGKYYPTGETREQSEIDKVFDATTKATQLEKANNADPTFYQTWADKWTGVTRDRASKEGKAKAKAGGAAPSTKPTTSLFASAPENSSDLSSTVSATSLFDSSGGTESEDK